MQPLAARLLQFLYPMLEEDMQNLQVAESEHRKTLDVLRRVVNGELDHRLVKVSDDGWQIIPEEPSDA